MKVLIFGGTREGRKLSAALLKAGMDVTLSVATEFGKDTAVKDGLMILADRLGEEDMINLLKQHIYDYIVDATHPYAVLATHNIRSACEAVGIKYLRLKRPESERIPGITYVSDAAAAVQILKKSTDKALLTIGSKELKPFIEVPNYQPRLFVRILPMEDSLKKALDLGFCGSNIICMQGPFDKEMNEATLKMTGAKCLVTKDSGYTGGFEAKISASLSLGCKVIVIARPIQEEGFTFNEILDFFNVKEESEQTATAQPAFFPLFIDMGKKKVLVVGGGKIAERRVRILSSFGADITVISPEAAPDIKSRALKKSIHLIERKYIYGDITNLKPILVIAATDDRKVNHEVMREASSLDIPVSVADCRKECSCYFPAIAESESYIAGLVSKNGDHEGVRQRAEKIRELFNS